jgi:tetratricopeptide (TPR) repeat protein
LAKIAVNKGLVFLAMHEWAQAENAFRTSATLFRTLGDVGEALNAQDGIGLAYLHQGRFAEASAIFAGSLQELATIGDGKAYAMLRRELSEHLAQASTAL